jgi:YfiH family protein
MNWTINQQQFGVILTNRNNGVSEFPYHSNNLALHVGDDEKKVNENRERLFREIGLDLSNFIFMNQVHGTSVERVDSSTSKTLTCDAMVTNCKSKVLMVMVADCVPILFADHQNNVIGVAHAGWKGTVGAIVNNVVNKMMNEYGCQLETIKVWQGPCIQDCCYYVGEDVVQACKIKKSESKVFRKANGNDYLNMQEYNRQLLMKMGIPEQNITLDKTCVACNVNEYFSYRADNARTGRFAAGIWIK